MKVFATLQVVLLIMASLIPEGRWLATVPDDSGSDCCCSQEQQQNGTCCCVGAKTDAPATGAKCCGVKRHQKNDDSRRTSRRKKLLRCGAFTICPCGSAADVSIIMHAPRTPVSRSALAWTADISTVVCQSNDSRQGNCFPPETPPPDSHAG